MPGMDERFPVMKAKVMTRCASYLLLLWPGQYVLVGQCRGSKKGDPTQFSDRDSATAIGSRSSEVTSRAVAEIVRRGDRMLPQLIRLRGCRNKFFGAGLGNPQSAQLIPAKTVGGLSAIPVEQAALYLISAIHRRSLSFAESPFLVDLALRPDARKASTSRHLNRRAWKAVLDWDRRTRGNGGYADSAIDDSPLKGAEVAFW
jgi:hypothetical protein